MEILGHTWFSNSRGTIGIVVFRNEMEVKAKISIVAGINMDSDIKCVVDLGSTFPLDAARLLIKAKADKVKQYKDGLGIDLEG